MLESVSTLSSELRDELARNSAPAPINTRSFPLRFHNLKAMGQSAAHCLQSFRNDGRESLPLRIGKGTHSLVFGGPPVVEWTGKVRNGKAWDAFKAEHDGSIVLSSKEYAQAHAIDAALRGNELAARVLFQQDAKREQTILWDQQGRQRRSTPDVRGFRYVVDLKTTRCAEPGRFTRDAMFRGYHAQLADYCDAIEASGEARPQRVYIVAVETIAPYAVTVLQLTERALEQGGRLVRTWFERFRACEDANAWPAYCESIVDFDVPDDELGLVFGDDAEQEGDE